MTKSEVVAVIALVSAIAVASVVLTTTPNGKVHHHEVIDVVVVGGSEDAMNGILEVMPQGSGALAPIARQSATRARREIIETSQADTCPLCVKKSTLNFDGE